MSSNLLNFRPASYHKGKECYVSYYCVDPSSDRLRRVKVKVNHVKKPSERERFARALCNAINDKLYDGWNPFEHPDGVKGITIENAVGIFMKEKEKSSRDTTITSYRSITSIFLEYCKMRGTLEADINSVNDAFLTQFMNHIDKERHPSGRTFNNYMSYLYKQSPRRLAGASLLFSGNCF